MPSRKQVLHLRRPRQRPGILRAPGGQATRGGTLGDWPDVHSTPTPSGLRMMSTGCRRRGSGNVLDGECDLETTPLFAVAAGHLVADRDLASPGDVDAHGLADAGAEVVISTLNSRTP